jgi:uncharacterized protein (DUF362 family)
MSGRSANHSRRIAQGGEAMMHGMKGRMDRREFLVRAAAAGATITGAAVLAESLGIPRVMAAPRLDRYRPPVDLVVAQGGSPGANALAAVAALGGFGKFVRAGDRVVIKPNPVGTAAPEKAIHTHPEIVEMVIRECLRAGAREVVAVSGDDPDSARRNGTIAAVERGGGIMKLIGKPEEFRTVFVPRGRAITRVDLAADLANADVFINLPIAKHHAATRVTLAMKNLMGLVRNARSFHSIGLHQCIADLSTAVPHDLVIMDANHVLLTNGPAGPGKVLAAGQVVAGIDPVAVDSYCLKYFGLDLAAVPHIGAAAEQGAGVADLSRLSVREVKA